MGVGIYRSILCWTMAVVFPLSLAAQDSGAMLYANGTVMLNHSEVPHSFAIFPGALIQTQPDSQANINLAGSNAMVLTGSVVHYNNNELVVEHGKITVATSKQFVGRACEVKVTPTSTDWTEYELSDVDGTVRVVAHKGSIKVEDKGHSETLTKPDQTARRECEPAYYRTDKQPGAGAVPAGVGGVMDSPIGIAVAGAAIGGVLTWVFLQGDDPMSPDKP